MFSDDMEVMKNETKTNEWNPTIRSIPNEHEYRELIAPFAEISMK